MTNGKRVVVIGAGAAGMMAALFAAEAGAETLLLEKTKSGGKKVLISGGGRCNILPVRVDESRFVTDSSRNSLRKILGAWPLADQIAFFEREAKVKLKEESDTGKLFPVSDRAAEVRDNLLRIGRERGVKMVGNSDVNDLRPIPSGWRVFVRDGEAFDASAVILATGGLSVPKTGSDGFGLRIAKRLGHVMHETYPALTPLTSAPPAFADLAGISLNVHITASDDGRTAESEGGFLFTHKGYSGPSVLDVSHVAVRSRLDSTPPARVRVSWTELNETAWTKVLTSVEQSSRPVAAVIREKLPARLAAMILEQASVDPDRHLARMPRDERKRLVSALTKFELPWNGDEGYKKAEVTGGGVDLGEVNPKTMESRRHPGLYLCGEMLDAFGPIGGYNFLWAWATGRAAGGAAGASF